MLPERRMLILVVDLFLTLRDTGRCQPDQAAAAVPPVQLAQGDLVGGQQPRQAVGDAGILQAVTAARFPQGPGGLYNVARFMPLSPSCLISIRLRSYGVMRRGLPTIGK